MTAPVNVIAVLHQLKTLMVYLIFFFCFSCYTNSRKSAESIAAKRQNLPTNANPKGAYYNDLHEFKERILSLNLPGDWQISDKSYEICSIEVYVSENLEFIIRVSSWCIPLDHEIYIKYKKQWKI